MDQYLTPINRVEDAPAESYVIYKITGGLYYCENKNYIILCKQLSLSSNPNEHLTMDLSCTQGHALVFDIDIKFSDNSKFIPSQHLLLSYYEKVFSIVLKTHFGRLNHFTTIVALRENFVGGMHVHLPEFIISHDDYIEFCSLIQADCSKIIPQIGAEIKLDIVCNFSLSKCTKPNSSHYAPVLLIYYDEKKTHTIDLSQGPSKFASDMQKVKKEFKTRKGNETSLFRKLLTFERFPDMLHRLFEMMMPVVNLYKPIYNLTYPTLIAPMVSEEQNDFLLVATFVYNNRKRYVISKNFNELLINEKDWLKCYKYLTMNSHAISEFDSKNRALRNWYGRNKSKFASADCNEDIFALVNQDLTVDNYNFIKDPNPLHTILSYEKGYYFLPVFYALCNHLKQPSNVLVSYLRPMFDDDPFVMQLLEKLERIEPKLIENISQEFTINTILYCGSNLREKQSCRFQEKIRCIISEMEPFLKRVYAIDDVIDLIRKIQERHYPIMTASIRHSCKKPQMYNWNLTHEYWQIVEKESHVEKSISVIWSTITEFVRKTYSKSECINWMKAFGKFIAIKPIVDGILYETYQDRKIIEMDRHKWHIRTNDGILDLLTGHVGATVPEFYMSERKLSVSFNRQDILNIRYNGLELLRVYETLTDRRFFQKYLKCLFDDVTEDLLDTLLYLTSHEKESENDSIQSMYKFYVHLCKYTSFEYDRMMYMLDVLASLLVATNYMRKFFILKGVTKNGKSKFFQMISRIFGGYSYTARSVNLQNNQSQGLNAMPELASSLFGCRVITVEELSGKLNENLIKEITGNSATSFRNLYEQNSGGIPTAKIFASTNTFPECTATEAFRDRVVAIPFDAKFCLEAKNFTTSQMVLQEKYILETNDSVTEDSHKGFFIMAYLHLIQNMNPKDGTLHYRDEPEALVEFKEEILFMTDIYIQFKQFMDVQYLPNSQHAVTFTELKSAIRHFLKSTKNSSVQEADIIVRFDEEFFEVKKIHFTDQDDYVTDERDELGSVLDPSESLIFRYGAQTSPVDEPLDTCKRKADDDENEDSKKLKSDDENESNRAVYYEGVFIRNLGRISKQYR